MRRSGYKTSIVHTTYVDDIPQQHITVIEISPKPNNLVVTYDAGAEFLNGSLETPRSIDFLFSVEWAWSPAHGRIDNYYLNRKRKHWVLWNNWMDDNDIPWRWNWSMVAHASRIKANELDVATHLLLESWKRQKEYENLDKYHWINNEGSLNADDIEAIAREYGANCKFRSKSVKLIELLIGNCVTYCT